MFAPPPFLKARGKTGRQPGELREAKRFESVLLFSAGRIYSPEPPPIEEERL